MRKGTSTILAIIFSCQLCVLALGHGAIIDKTPSAWRATARGTAAVAALGEAIAQDGGPVPDFPPARPETTVPPDIPPAEPASASPRRPPVRGIYVTGYTAGIRKFDQILSFIRRTEVNAVVIDVKDDSGTLSYPSDVALAKAIGAGVRKFSPEKVLARLYAEGIYPIARIVVFKDPYLAAKRPDLAVRNKKGGLWRDRKGLAWVDPHNREVWRYAVDVAKEAAAKGFREIQFDYVRFTSDGQLSECVYPYATGQRKSEVIRDFLAYARQELRPLGVEVSADIFGLTCSALDDLGIGQRIEDISSAVDIISPMVYPSHYYRGTYGLQDPDLHPYETITASLRAAMPRVAATGVRIRPWLQDFSLRNHYGRAQLMAQIKAVYDAGLTEWIFWNPSNNYKPANYNPE